LGSRVGHQEEEVEEEVRRADEHHDDDVNGLSLREGYCHLMDDLLDSEWS
jgi:hypothetical protein